jgi:glycosyltransferase involved in cell wall biosynthesis
VKFVLLIYGDFPDGSAPPRRLLLLARGLVAAGHEVHVIVPQRFRPGPLFEEMRGVSVHWGRLTDGTRWSGLRERLAARRSAMAILRRLADGGLDWLLLSNPGLDGLAYAAIAKRRGARIAAMYDDLRAPPEHPSIMDRIRLWSLRTADRRIPRVTALNITISHFLREIVEQLAPTTPTFILPPLVDMDTFEQRSGAAAAFRAQWALGEAPVISYLGTYWFVEGLPVLLEAASRLARAGEQFRLVISGAAHEGLDCDSVSALVARFDLGDVVVETGWLPIADVVRAMSAADILAIPKLDDIANRAGVPTKLAEYLAMGRAIVVSRVGEIPRYLTDRTNAMLCVPGDVTSLTEALRALLNDRSLRERLAGNARAAAQEQFDYRTIVGRLAERMTELRSS